MMKVLIVCSFNKGKISPFIEEQVEELIKKQIIVDYYLIKGKGILGYISNIVPFYKKVFSFKPNLVHAHYGLSGLLANLQFFYPVITTYHGSDIHQKANRLKSKVCFKLSKENIFVAKDQANLLGVENNYHILPCGVNTKLFIIKDKKECREKLKLKVHKKYVLFSSHFSNKVKNASLAKDAFKILNNNDIELIELKGYSREEVVLLMNACDLVLMTSHNEGSPQFIKEAMACSTPIVSTNVGDVKELVGNTDGTFICENNAEDVAIKIVNALKFSEQHVKTQGRKRVLDLKFDNSTVAEQLVKIYKLLKS